MEIRGLVFAGTATDRHVAMAAFVQHTLGLRADPDSTSTAEMFNLPDGSRFAVHPERDDNGGTSRTIGFLVDDVEAAAKELAAAGLEVDEPSSNERHRYVHFVAPDGELYELVEELRPG